MILKILLISIIIIPIIVLFWTTWPTAIGAVWVPTPMNAVTKMLEIANINENDTLIDLGSGDGRIIIEAAKTYNANSVGIEADPIRVLWSRSRIKFNDLDEKVEVIWGNFFKTNLSNATVITVYQGLGINTKLKSKFQEELEPGTRIVSYTFTFDGWEPVEKDSESDVYLYII